LERASLAVDDLTGRLGFDLARVLLFRLRRGTGAEDRGTLCAWRLPGHHRLAQSYAARIAELLGLDLAKLRELSLGHVL
jgi:hypothetical protein